MTLSLKRATRDLASLEIVPLLYPQAIFTPLRQTKAILSALEGVGASLWKHNRTCVNPLSLLNKSTMTEFDRWGKKTLLEQEVMKISPVVQFGPLALD